MLTGRTLSSFWQEPIALPAYLTDSILYILFFCSGISALIYQVMWQRALFTLFGVDLISISIIISVFMFGLGIGGLLGGYIADKLISKLLLLYIGIELFIAIFGFFSYELIEYIGSVFFSTREYIVALTNFLLLALPTFLMGATFPILVAHVNQKHQNVGKSVGGLYCANTLGGAFGAYFSGFVLLSVLDVPGAIHYAATLNLAIAMIAWLVFRR